MDNMSFDNSKASPELSGRGARYSPSKQRGNIRDEGVVSFSSANRSRKNSGSTTARAAHSSVSTRTVGADHAQKKRSTRLSRIGRNLKYVRLGFFVLLLLLAASIVGVILTNKPSEQDVQTYIDDGTFLSGISINGRDVGGLSYRAACDVLLNDVNTTLRCINITIKHGTTLYVLNASDLGVTNSLDSILLEAISLGRGGTVIENAKVKDELAESGKNYAIEYSIDETATLAALKEVGLVMDTMPVEPTIAADEWANEPSFKYIEGTDGYMLNFEAITAQIKSYIESAEYNAVLTPELELVSPTATVESLMANAQFRSTFQTSFGGSSAARNEKRVGNIQKATTLLNGAKVENGEEFNFNGFIGPRTEAGGWPLAPGIVNGDRYEDQAGGGICQVSTTFYNALLCAGSEIQITERYHHSWPSSYADKGLDSTVTGTVDSGKSLNFINNTGSTLYIFAYCDTVNYTMTIYLYGVPLEDGVTYAVRGVVDEVIKPGETVTVENPEWPVGYKETTVKSRDGYKATAYRDKLLNGEVIETETLYTDTYRAVTGEVTVGTGSASLPTPSK